MFVLRSAKPIVCSLLASSLLLGCGNVDESLVLTTVKSLVGATARAAMAPAATDSDDASRSPAALASGSRDSGGDEITIIESGEASVLSESAGASGANALYSYIDSRGGAHMVRGLQNVPAPFRQRAKNLSAGGGRVINRYDAKSTLVKHRRLAAIDSQRNSNRGEVTLYSAEWCGACRRAKSFLDERGVAYDLRDIDDDPEAKEVVRRVLGSVRIPLLDIDGTYVAGYDPKQIGQLLDRI